MGIFWRMTTWILEALLTITVAIVRAIASFAIEHPREAAVVVGLVGALYLCLWLFSMNPLGFATAIGVGSLTFFAARERLR